MGQTDSTALGAKSTALEVYQHFAIERGSNFLEGKTVIVTGMAKRKKTAKKTADLL
jgi:hypothetical protein